MTTRRSLAPLSALSALLTLVAAAVRAQEPPEAPAEVTEQAKGEEKDKKKDLTRTEKRAIATTDVGVFGVKGRVFTGLFLRRESDRTVVGPDGLPRTNDVDSLDIVLDSARFSVLYQAPVRWLSTEVEIEVSDPDQVELRDAYIEAEGGKFELKAGNFKIPTSAFELESAWTLPSSRRGLMNDLLEDFLAIAGRDPGLQLRFREPKGIEPTFTVGVFQGRTLVEHVGDDRDTELIDEASLEAQSFAVRAQIELGKLDIGVFFEHRVGSREPLRTHHAPVVGADVVFDDEFGDFGARVWLDAHYGESWYAHSERMAGDGDPWFLSLRAIAAGRYGGTSDGMFYVESFASAGMLDPDLDLSADLAWELAAGVNVGLWDLARVTLEGFVNDTSRNFPESYFGGPRGQALGLMLLAGVAF